MFISLKLSFYVCFYQEIQQENGLDIFVTDPYDTAGGKTNDKLNCMIVEIVNKYFCLKFSFYMCFYQDIQHENLS